MVNLIVKSDEYKNEDAIDNLIKYMVNSKYTDYIDGYGILKNNLSSIINSFYLPQKYYNKTSGKRIHHIILTCKNYDFTMLELKDISQKLSSYIGENFQNVFTIHNGSNNNKNNIHVHFAINSINYNNGYKLYGTNTYYSKCLEVLKQLTELKVNLILK